MTQSAFDRPPAENAPAISAREISGMVQECFQGMLDLSCSTEPLDTVPKYTAPIEAAVQITGDWKARLSVVASESFARRISCSMFSLQHDECTREEMLDAWGEVINVIGGNVKGMYEGECSLTIPCVGRPEREQFEDGLRLTYECENENFTIWFQSA